jgi:hypothetical protein
VNGRGTGCFDMRPLRLGVEHSILTVKKVSPS